MYSVTGINVISKSNDSNNSEYTFFVNINYYKDWKTDEKTKDEIYSSLLEKGFFDQELFRKMRLVII